MNNLIIIGNGFDLAHGMRTSYGDFMKYLVNEHCRDRSKFTDLFELPDEIKNIKDLKQFVSNKIISNDRPLFSHIKNKFVELLLLEMAINNNWSDIEQKYFNELLQVGKKRFTYKFINPPRRFDIPFYSPKELNDEFEVLKAYLSEYLSIQQNNSKAIACYKRFFKTIASPQTLILNFNYTLTLNQHYQEEISASEIVPIHGRLYDYENPIIFGYAADFTQARGLLDKLDNEYMINIKKHLYKKADKEDKLLCYLKNNNDIDVSIFGHSCGISDNLILNQIFNHPHVKSIRIFYYDNCKNKSDYYSQTITNIDRIIRNEDRFRDLLFNFRRSHRMPQLDDIEEKTNSFSEYITNLVEEQKC